MTQTPIPFPMLALIEWKYGQGTIIEFCEIPPEARARFGGHRCLAQVRVPVGPAHADRHCFHASGESYLEAVKNLLS